MKEVVVVIGPGSVGQAIVRRVSAGKHVLLADLRKENTLAAAKTLEEAGFDVRHSAKRENNTLFDSSASWTNGLTCRDRRSFVAAPPPDSTIETILSSTSPFKLLSDIMGIISGRTSSHIDQGSSSAVVGPGR